jgi:sugar phosphate isomerase/epimerase
VKFALSTNWCSRRIESGEEIADLALSLGFDELELGFAAQERQIEGFRRRLDSMPVGSVHAFCPVPISAPTASPELYSLASFDEGERALAAMHLKRNIAFAADIGAKTVVLHAGRVGFSGPLRRLDSILLRSILEQEGANTLSRRHMKALSLAQCRRLRRGRKMLDIFMRELSGLVGELERHDVTLGLENLPYLEGFPDEREMEIVAARFGGSRVKAWFDTGHDRVRQMHGWVKGFAARAAFRAGASFVPSPVTATTASCSCKSLTRRCLSIGRARHIILSPITRSAASLSERASNSGPVIIAESGVSLSHIPI